LDHFVVIAIAGADADSHIKMIQLIASLIESDIVTFLQQIAMTTVTGSNSSWPKVTGVAVVTSENPVCNAPFSEICSAEYVNEMLTVYEDFGAAIVIDDGIAMPHARLSASAPAIAMTTVTGSNSSWPKVTGVAVVTSENPADRVRYRDFSSAGK
jgi:mannitol/fructose-specific phosphotransferase system IIA component (Ntr-type)